VNDELQVTKTLKMTWLDFALQTLASTARASSVRIVSENVIERIRDWKIMLYPFRQYHKEGEYSLSLEKVVKGLAFVINRVFLLSPTRRPRVPTWRPKQLRVELDNIEYGYAGECLNGSTLGNFVSKNFIAKSEEYKKRQKVQKKRKSEKTSN
jgi:hypothetical protein